MKAVRAAINEYYLGLPKAVEALQHQLLGLQSSQSSNNAPAIENDPDVTPLPPADSDKEDNDADVTPLNPADSDKEGNDTDVPTLTSTDYGEEYNDPELTPLPLVDSAE